ncbi:hypothetical protein DSO57_1021677 [Entomophthora muscae]|uniref:Uncharacterized protein n=2 Tax=Entomophthora muscae TaxID=34485 RepID=A0ACC2U1R7_9FUNG|nr:hypothetical protein DSO57_1021677 [Entomophthora muscae]
MDTITRLVYTHERHSLVDPVQHPKFRLSIFTARSFYTAGGSFSGNLKLQCKTDQIKFKNLRVELVGLEEISRASLLQREIKRHTFSKTAHIIPESQHLLSKVVDPDSDGFFEADKGEYLVPFEMQLSLKLPTSTEPDRIKRHVSIRYLAIGSIDLKLSNGQYITVIQTLPIVIYEKVQLKSELRVKLAETPQSAEIFHTFPGSSTTMFLRLSIAKTIWVSGSLLTAQVILRKALKRKVSKIQLELIEDVRTFRNPTLVVEEDDNADEESYTEGSNTLVNPITTRGASSPRSSSSLDSVSCVVGKRALGGNSTPTQVDLETEERRWNLQVMVPSDSHTSQKARFSSITYRVRASISFFMTKQISIELPVLIVHPLSLDIDPYQNIRDGVLLTAPYAFGNVHKYRVYEQPMDGIGHHLTSTSMTEHLAITQMKGMHSPKASNEEVLLSSSTMSPFSSDSSSNGKLMEEGNSSRAKGLPMLDCDTISCHSSTYTISTAPNSPSKPLRSFAANFRSHRRAKSEACKNDFFFQTSSSGELPRINLNWDWVKQKPNQEDFLPDSSPPAKTCSTSSHFSTTLESSETGNFTGKNFYHLDGVSLDDKTDQGSSYTDKCPWRSQLGKDRRQALSLYSLATPVNSFSMLPTSQNHVYASITPSSNISESTLISRDSSLPFSQHSRTRFHPEVVSRKYSFPPKQVPKSASNFKPSTTSQVLKSAFSKHKRAQTCGDSVKVRFMTDSDVNPDPSWSSLSNSYTLQGIESTPLSCRIPSNIPPSCNFTPAFPNNSVTPSPMKCCPVSLPEQSPSPALDARPLMAVSSRIGCHSTLTNGYCKVDSPMGSAKLDTLALPQSLDKELQSIHQPTIGQSIPASTCPKVVMILGSRPRTRWRESFHWRSKAALSSKKRLSMPCQTSTQFRQTTGWEDVGEDNTSPSMGIPISKPHLKQD